jgi:thiosulfate/3-mercaptopyruvate sulfurtransferase
VTTSGYAYPEVLCETEWVANNLKNSNVRILEVDYDPENAYKEGHVPGAHLVWWRRDINDRIRRDIIDKQSSFRGLRAELAQHMIPS